jgi:glyceraldehyde 3-phosphate dehydrogenase
MSNNSNYDSQLNIRIDNEKAAAEFVKIVTDLWFDKSIELMLFRKPLLDQSTSEILNTHNYARKIVGQPITIFDTLLILQELCRVDIAPARMDVGKLASEWLAESDNYGDVSSFIQDKLSDFIGKDKLKLQPKDVVLYGFGRIGRLVARELIRKEGRGEQLRLRAIVTRQDDDESIIKRASLLRMDSVHGDFPGLIEEDLENKMLIIDGNPVLMIAAKNPEDIDYTAYGINNALIIDNTGVFKDKTALSRHLQAKGADKVLLTAPGKEIPNIVYGVNQTHFPPEDNNIYSAASCTTNAITPVLKVINDVYGVEKGHIETVHAYTNDQNLVDNMHSKYRRGRAAALNMVITETGAGKAVTKAIPELEGKLTSNAIRVPVPNGSLAILNLTLEKETSKEDLNETLRKHALAGDLVEQIEYSMSNELVSSDIVGRTAASIYDSPATIASNDGKNVVVYVWYDNEYGYTNQVMRLAKYVSKVRRLRYY